MAAVTAQAEVRAGNVAAMINRLSKDLSNNRPPISVHDGRKSLMSRSHPSSASSTAGSSSVGQSAIAQFPYAAQQPDELTLEKDDIVEIVEEVEDGWNRGRHLRTGRTGLYPTNFTAAKVTMFSSKDTSRDSSQPSHPATPSPVEERPKRLSAVQMPPVSGGAEGQPEAIQRTPSATAPITTTFPVKKDESKPKEMARVLFVYSPQHEDELALPEVGALIEIVRKDCGDPGWFEGELNGKRGLFPDNFVELVKLPSSISGSHSPPKPEKAQLKAPLPAPGAASIVPPQVPAKPSKPLLPSSTSSSTPSSTAAQQSPPLPAKPLSAFAALKNNIAQGLVIKAPGDAPPILSKSTTSLVEPVGPTLEEKEEAESVGQLTHITKGRPRQAAGRRPVSMVALKKKASMENLLDDSPTAPAPAVPVPSAMSQSVFAPSTSPQHSAKPSAVKESVAMRPLHPPTSSIFASSAPVKPTPTHVVNGHSEGEWVSRQEYNAILGKVSALEARLAALERR